MHNRTNELRRRLISMTVTLYLLHEYIQNLIKEATIMKQEIDEMEDGNNTDQ
jgi:hypothetical protein